MSKRLPTKREEFAAAYAEQLSAALRKRRVDHAIAQKGTDASGKLRLVVELPMYDEDRLAALLALLNLPTGTP